MHLTNLGQRRDTTSPTYVTKRHYLTISHSYKTRVHPGKSLNIKLIESLIHVFAVLIVIHPPGEILSFCSNISIDSHSGLEILLTKWTETFEVLQGYNQIRLSVVALSRIFEWGVEGIMVRGDEITEPTTAGRIVTRSQRRQGRTIRNALI
jgi:importin-9